jgi:hypothetical protein
MNGELRIMAHSQMNWTNSFITSGQSEYKSPCLTVPLLFCFFMFNCCCGNMLTKLLPSNRLLLSCSLQCECMFGEPSASNGLLLWLHYSSSQKTCQNILPNLLILSNNTFIEECDRRLFDVPFKWQLPSPASTSDFRMAVAKNAKKQWPLYSMGNQKWHLLCLYSFLYNEWKVLLHVMNAEGSCAMDFCHLENHWPGLNSRTLGPMVSTLPRDHWCVPCDSYRMLDN